VRLQNRSPLTVPAPGCAGKTSRGGRPERGSGRGPGEVPAGAARPLRVNSGGLGSLATSAAAGQDAAVRRGLRAAWRLAIRLHAEAARGPATRRGGQTNLQHPSPRRGPAILRGRRDNRSHGKAARRPGRSPAARRTDRIPRTAHQLGLTPCPPARPHHVITGRAGHTARSPNTPAALQHRRTARPIRSAARRPWPALPPVQPPGHATQPPSHPATRPPSHPTTQPPGHPASRRGTGHSPRRTFAQPPVRLTRPRTSSPSPGPGPGGSRV
jgi:hypothetical protein